MSKTTTRLKPWILPIAMVVGILFHEQIGAVQFLSRYLIFIMLLITYCKVSFRHFRPDGSMWLLLAVQIVGAAAVYMALLPLDRTTAEAVFICIFCPTATAAPVITGMLGGKVEKVASYSLISNLTIALLAPLIFAYMTDTGGVTFIQALKDISVTILPLLLGPLVAAVIVRKTLPAVHQTIARHQGLSFYIWALALLIVAGNSVSFIMREPSGCIPQMLLIAALSLAACLAQFAIGRRIGRKYGDPVAGAQSLGQKNTVLAIWLTLTYFNPIASVGPAAYIMWHNSVNSWQIWKKSHKEQDNI